MFEKEREEQRQREYRRQEKRERETEEYLKKQRVSTTKANAGCIHVWTCDISSCSCVIGLSSVRLG